jgi:hypothetical protein
VVLLRPAYVAHRFERWITSLPESITAESEEALVPVDVLMVWHTYLLNPGWYVEDCLRLRALRAFNAIKDHFFLVLVRPFALLRDLYSRYAHRKGWATYCHGSLPKNASIHGLPKHVFLGTRSMLTRHR